LVRKRVLVSGEVQGVFYRDTCRRLAGQQGVSGWVRNLPDGRVELQAAGEEAEVRAFVEAIRQSELRGHIREQTEFPLDHPPIACGFEIRHD
jgi:acylphosphatase